MDETQRGRDSTWPLLMVSENTHREGPEGRLQSPSQQPTSPREEAVPVPGLPRLDPAAKQLLQKEQKQADVLLPNMQTFILNAVEPLVHVVEEVHKGTLTGEQKLQML